MMIVTVMACNQKQQRPKEANSLHPERCSGHALVGVLDYAFDVTLHVKHRAYHSALLCLRVD